MKLLGAIRPTPSGTVIKVTITVLVVSAMPLIFVCMLVQSFLKFGANNLCNVHAFMLPFFGLVFTCTPVIFDRNAIFIKTMTVYHAIALVCPPCFLHSMQCFSGSFQWTSHVQAFLRVQEPVDPSFTPLQPLFLWLHWGAYGQAWQYSWCSWGQTIGH